MVPLVQVAVRKSFFLKISKSRFNFTPRNHGYLPRLFSAGIRDNAFQTIPGISFFGTEFFCCEIFRSEKVVFLRYSLEFCGFRYQWASPSASSSNFALDTLIMSSVQPKIIECKTIMCLAKTSSCLAKTHLRLAATHVW